MFAACDGSVLLQCHGQCWVTAVCIIQFKYTRCCPSSLSKLVYVIYLYNYIYIKLVTSTVSLVLFTQLAYNTAGSDSLDPSTLHRKIAWRILFSRYVTLWRHNGLCYAKMSIVPVEKTQGKCHPPVVFLHVHLIN